MENNPHISNEVPKALKPQNKQDFGYFLAGLIDSDGHIRKNGSIVIAFNAREASVAYYLKKIIGSGSVYKVKDRHAVSYECTGKVGLTVISDLIRNKLKHLDKIAQYNDRLAKKLNCEVTIYTESHIKQNHWLAGFLQGDGCLVIYQLKRSNRAFFGTRISVQASQKEIVLLELIKTSFKGYISYRASNQSYSYSSVSFKNAVSFIKYLDEFQLIGCKFTEYIIWRKAFLVVQSKLHNSEAGSKRIAFKKLKLSQLRKK